MSKNSEHVKAAHQKQLAAGWRRLGLRLPPQASADLALLETLPNWHGKKPTEIISMLLRGAVEDHAFMQKICRK